MELLKIREHPDLALSAAAWFHTKWQIPQEEYETSIRQCLRCTGAIPQWYAAVQDGAIIGGAGVIENDFHKRTDLTPNICALYVSEEYRGRGLAGQLLQLACDDMAGFGIHTLYLITEHTSFYERYGWQFLCMAEENSGELIRMYVRQTK